MWIQKGENSKYPEKIDCWRLEDGDAPDWITDYARISGINQETGRLQIVTRDTTTGGYEIVSADGKGMLIFVHKKENFICKDMNNKFSKLFVLTEKQRDLLYKQERD